ncbi:methyltransferase domain-containing protein [Streptomyces sp. SID5643]|uniref:methyltransferase domain-containing protein n=1 Tax=Streptomyces sp. SID5643 TaxID=2690307 RepID=UPI0013684871|nr:methyltransferase domain-containing protein [Streptomyces sp. SID5643]MZF88716.1 methyltransferase domain-containing protein [Streptomyces sp. SID5643]
MTSLPDPGPPRPTAFEDLVAEGASVPTDGWDFSWFEGRATEARPSWGYAVSLAGRLGRASAVLDAQTGGGEVLDFALSRVADATTGRSTTQSTTGATAPAPAPKPPLLTVATEGWPPNVAKATALLRPRGVAVIAAAEDDPLPFADGAFDLVVSRHPVRPHWGEIARVLQPGGTYFAQHVGPNSVFELVEYFLGPQPEGVRSARHPDRERADAEAAGLEIVDLRAERLRVEFHDIGAVVHFLRKVVWMVPGFTVEAYEPKLRELHERIRAEGPFVAHSTRHLFDARKPG